MAVCRWSAYGRLGREADMKRPAKSKPDGPITVELCGELLFAHGSCDAGDLVIFSGHDDGLVTISAL